MSPDRNETPPDWRSLQDGIDGEVVLADSTAYDAVNQPFNLRFEGVRPRGIVRCATPQDVAEAMSFVVRHGLPSATRSGGHCFGGRSSSTGVVVDVTLMDSVTVSDGGATVGAGARLGPVYDALQERGRAIPGGTCPSVGIAGLTLGGGLGILGRSYGVTSDQLVGADVVLADGRIVRCDEHHHDDLFWALRGAGAGSFGVVTSFDFRTVPAPEATNIHATWPPSQAAAAIEAWQAWSPTGPDGLAASLKVTTTGDLDQPPSVDLYAAVVGGELDAAELLDDLVVRVGSDPTSARHSRMSFPETRRFWADLGAEQGASRGGPLEATQRVHLHTKSEFFRRPLSGDAIAGLVEALAAERVAGESRELDFMPWGGAYNRVPPDATAFVHRDELFQLKHSAVIDPPATAAAAAAAQRWVSRSWAAVHPWGSGRVFQNFADPDLEDWAEAYYGTNYDRLRRVKARYDPSGVFRVRQSIDAGHG
ncbi:MAG TPA: FAD-binding oxidoreductase [Acidimicrobiales bacterium]|nr:FAD-binding oxidoreductase [Acidimicrobiales bacterium]